MNNLNYPKTKKMTKSPFQWRKLVFVFLLGVLGSLALSSDVFAYQIKRVIRGTTSMDSTTESLTQNIYAGYLNGEEMVPEKCLIIVTAQVNADNRQMTDILASVDDGQNITFNRRVSGNGSALTIRWMVVEFVSGVSVISGITIVPDGSIGKTITIPELTSLDKAFVVLSTRSNANNTAYDESMVFGGQLRQNGALYQLRLERGLATIPAGQTGAGTCNEDIGYQIVVFDPTDTDVTVQHGTTLLNALSLDAPINQITMNKAFLKFSIVPNSGVAGYEDRYAVDGYIKDTTHATFTRKTNTSSVQVWWQIIQIKNDIYGIFTDRGRVSSATNNADVGIGGAVEPIFDQNVAEKRSLGFMSVSGGQATSTARLDLISYSGQLNSTGAAPALKSTLFNVARTSASGQSSNISAEVAEFPPLRIKSPVGSTTTWKVGDSVTIEWYYSNDLKTNGTRPNGTHSLKIELTKNGTNYYTVADNVDTDTGTFDNVGSYSWTVKSELTGLTNTIGENIKLRISDNDLAAGFPAVERRSDQSLTGFVIKGVMNVAQPPNTWKIGETQDITWSYKGKLSTLANPGNTVTISINPGSGWVDIKTDQPIGTDGSGEADGSGVYHWVIPPGLPVATPTQNLIGDDNQVRITQNYNPAPVGQTAVTSTCGSAFTLKGQISDVVRNPDATWLLGQPVSISWSKKGFFDVGATDGNVKIYYSPTGVAPFTELTNANGLSAYPVPAGTDAGGGTVNWAIPFTMATSNPSSIIKVEHPTDNTVSSSSATFLLSPSMTLTAPVAGDIWRIGESHSIQWTPHGALGNVIIKYAFNDDWDHSTTIATVPGGTAEAPQTKSWTVINPIGLNAKIRIYKESDPNIYVESGVFHLKPVINVTSPGAGDIVKVTEPVENNKQTILWNFSGGVTGNVDIALSSDDTGDSFPTVLSANSVNIDNLTGGAGSFPWTVAPGHIGTQRVRVAWHDDPETSLAKGSCASSGVFKTVAYLKYLSPNTANQSFNIGDTIFIKWTPYPANNTWKVDIKYSVDGGAFNKFVVADNTIDANNQPDGGPDYGYKWTIPDVSGIIKDTVRFQVYQDGKQTDVHSEGNYDITIKGSITLTGEANGVGSPTWLIGDPKNITWSVVGDVGNVDILYTKDGTQYDPVASNQTVAGTGDYNYQWTIPGSAITGDLNSVIKFKITNTKGTVSLPSANPITIRAKIDSITPTSGTTVFVSDTDNVDDVSPITWQNYYHGNMPQVKLKLYNPKTSAWEDINNGDPLNNAYDSGSFGLWHVPNAIGDTAKIRVSSASANENVVFAESGSTFKIKGKFRIDAPTITNKGATALKVHSADRPSTYTIQWKNIGDIPAVKLYFSPNGGTYQEIAVVSGANGNQSLVWQPLDSIGTANKLKFADPSELGVVYKESDPFEIKGQLDLTTPRRGGTYPIGADSYIDIYWTYAGSLGNIDIYYSPDNGATSWVKKDTVAVTYTQPYRLLVPNVPTLGGAIKIQQVNDPDGMVVSRTDSDAPFWVRGDIKNVQIHNLVNNAWKVNGASNRITWDYTGAIANVDIKLDTQSGTGGYGITVANDAPNSGEYVWSILPQDYVAVTSDTCRIQVSDSGIPAVFAVNSADFAIKPVITLSHPQGQTDSWEVGYSHDITWDYLGAISKVKIQFSEDGTNWPETTPYLIVASTSSGTTPETKKYSWTVPDTMSGQCLVRITKVSGVDNVPDPDVSDDSDSAFAIKAKVAVTQPAGGAIRANSSYDIKWSTTGTLKPTRKVKLEFAPDGSNFVAISGAESLTSNPGVETTYSWSVPDSSSAQAKVRVVSNDEASIKSESNFFSLRKLNLLTPNGGEHWEVHTPQTITWQAEQVGTVEAEYSIDGGTIWTPISGTAPGNGSMSWTMADNQQVSQNCKVRIKDHDYPSISDTSDLAFDIKAYLRVTAPVGGVPVVATDPCTITWDSYGDGVPDVILQYYNSTDSTWYYINPVSPYKVANSIGAGISKLWSVPANALADQAKIKITDPNNSNANDTGTSFWIKGTISVTTPSTGTESWDVGSKHNIVWTTKGDIALVNIYYSPENGADGTWVPLPNGSNIPGNSPFWEWNIVDGTSLTANRGKIKVTDAAHDTNVYGINANNFTIKGSISNVTTDGGPNYVYTGASTMTVHWDYYGAVQTFEIYYAADGVNYLTKLGEVPQPNKQATVPIPNSMSSIGKIRVQDKNNSSSVGGELASPITIKGSIAVNDITTNTVWVVGSKNDIKWTPTGTYTNDVKLEYLVGGTLRTPVIATAPVGASGNQQTFAQWTTPDDISDQVKIRVSTQENNAAIDVVGESAVFKIRGDISAVTAPTTGDVWNVGDTTKSIVWTKVGTVTPVKIEFYDGTSTSTLIASYDAGAGNSWAWKPSLGGIPNVKSENCTVTVTDTRSALVTKTSNVFAIRPVITVTAPATVRAGQNVGINWSITGSPCTVGTIQLQQNVNGTGYVDVGAPVNASAGSGTITWAVPTQTSTNTYLRVVDATNSNINGVSGLITIAGYLTIDALSTTNWDIGSTQTIAWHAKGISRVITYYSLNGIDGWTAIENGANGEADGETPVGSGLGSAQWTIPETVNVSQSAKIKIVDKADQTGTYAISPETVHLKAAFSQIIPSAGSTVPAKEQFEITWYTKGSGVAKVLLEYKDESGWHNVKTDGDHLVNNVQGANSYLWQPYVPEDALSDAAQIRITDPGNAQATATGTNFWIYGALTVTVPSGTQSWEVGTPQIITWTEKGYIPTVKVYYSPDAAGENWKPLGTAAGTDLHYDWDINSEETLSTTARIKVTDATKPAYETLIKDISDGVFTVKGRIFNVTTDGGPNYVYTGASTMTVHWDYYGAVQTFEIYYAADGVNYLTKLGEVPQPNKQATVPIPNSMSSIGKIRVQDKNNSSSVGGELASPITIKGSIAVNDITTNTVWVVGSKNDIKWTPTGTYTNDVKLEYLVGGTLRTPVIATAPVGASGNQQTFAQWTTPDDISDQVKIRVSTQENNAAIDVVGESAVFKIRGDISAVTAPTTGDVWNVGDTTKSIVWTKVGTVTPVKIEFYDGTSTSTLIASYDAGAGNSWAWKPSLGGIPNVKSENCTVTVTDTRSALVTKTSNVFAIRPVITVTAPATVSAAQNVGINWSITGSPCTVNKVKLQQNVDGAGYVDVLTDIDATSGSGTTQWAVPAQKSTNTYVRIIDQNNSNIYGSSVKITITGYLKLLSPNGTPVQEHWQVGTTQSISWTSSAVSSVKAYYSYNGTDWPFIAQGSGTSMNWVIAPGFPVSNNVLVKITDAENESGVYSVSEQPFEIIAVFDVQHPENGDVLTAETPYLIQWDNTKSTGVNKIILEYSTQGGAVGTWNFVNSAGDHTLDNNGSYSWTVPANALSMNCKMRVRDPNNSLAAAVSEGVPFRIKSSLTLTSPTNGTESWGAGTPHDITWTKKGDIANILIEYSPDQGLPGTWQDVATVPAVGVPADSLKYTWNIPAGITLTNQRSGVIRISVQGVESDVTSSSTNFFEIKGTLTLITPDSAGISLPVTDPYLISWNQFGAISTVQIFLSTDGASYPQNPFQEVTVSGSSGSFSWQPDINSISKNCRIKIQDKNNSTVKDESADLFEIKGKVVLNSPSSAGIKWFYNEAAQIRWTPTGNYAQVKLEYSLDNFATAGTPIATVDAGASGVLQTYDWNQVTIPISESARIRVSDPNSTTVQATSANDLSVRGRLRLIIPNGTETWTVGTKHFITWSTLNGASIPKVDLSYSVNAQPFTEIIANLDNSGSYEWNIPTNTIISDNVLVKVADHRYPDDTSVSDVSDNPFKTVAGISLTAPINSTSEWGVGTVQHITWIPQGDIPSVDITYTDGITPSIPIRTGWDGNSGDFPWTVPNNPNITSKVKVVDVRKPDTVFAVSPENFSIVGSLTVIKPAPGDSWIVGNQKEITWSTNGTLIPKVKILLSLDGGSSWEQITDNGSGGSYFWDIPDVPTDKSSPRARIKIIDASNPRVLNEMSGNFKLQPQFNVTSPSTGQMYGVTDNVPVAWQTLKGVVSTVKLEYRKSGSDPWSIIRDSIGNSGTFNWPAENAISSTVVIRVCDTRDESAFADSGVFVIHGKVALQGITTNTVWIAETPVTINWDITGSVSQVDLSYSATGGEPYSTVIASGVTATDKTKSWTAPIQVTNQARVKIVGDNDIWVVDESPVFKVRGSITVTFPNGPADQWLAGNPHNIKWTRTGDFTNVKISLSPTGGEPYSVPIDTWAAGGGTYAWGIPADFQLGTQYKIKIADAADETNVFDTSDANFGIIGSLTLVNPNTGGTWYVDDPMLIEWVRNGGIAYVDIDISKNGFADESETSRIATQTDATGTPPGSYHYSWTTGDYIGTNTKIRVQDHSNAANVYAISSVPFTIKGSLTLLSPNGGNVLEAEAPLTVQWEHHGTIPTVKIEYSTNGGGLYSGVVVPTTNGMINSCSTFVPSVIGSAIKLRVSDTQDDRSRSDESDANFTIKGKLTLTSPVTRVSWPVGTSQEITWSVKGPIQYVRIQYSTDANWATAPDVIASTDAQSGHYTWSIPTSMISSTVLLKITDTLDPSVATISPMTFKLVGVLGVSEPTAATRWEVGVPANIIWTKTGPIDQVMIDLSKDGGSTWINGIIGPIGGTSTSYTPAYGDVTYRSVIRVRDASDPEVFALTPQFHIKAKFNISVPNGDVWPVQSSQTLVWNTIGTVPTVKIEYSKDNAVTWLPIAPSTQNNNNYPWTVPNAVSSTCFVRISDYNDSEAVGVSGQFKIRGAISLLQPSDAGISWVVDSLQHITWSTTGDMDKVTLQVSTTGADPYYTINSNVAATDHNFDWTIPTNIPNTSTNILSKTCKIKIFCNDDPLAVLSTSANNFAICGQLAVSQPTTGTVWRVGGTGNVQWQRVHGNIQYLTIKYSTNGPAGPFDKVIAPSVLASGASFNWGVLDTLSETAVVRVEDKDNSDVYADSDQFAIKGKLTLTRPITSSERFVYGSHENISWNVSGSISTVTLEYTLDDGGHFTLINNAVSASASPFSWQVPNEHSDNVKVKISDNGDPTNVSDISPQAFKIVGILNLISPGGGEVWPVASNQSVTWSVGGSKVARIKIDYSLDGGATYPYTIANDIPAGPQTSINYTIPEDTDLSQQVVVRVSDMLAWSNVFATSSKVNMMKIRGDLVVTRPLLNDAFLLLDSEDIRWTRLGKILAVNIDYSTDGTFNPATVTHLVQNLAHVAGNNQSYTWSPVPNPPTTSAKIRIYDSNDSSVYATSSQFTIRGGFKITAPNNGTESWAVGSEQLIDWETKGSYMNVRLDYSTDNGAHWNGSIANNTPNAPPFHWTIPTGAVISDQYRVRIMDVVDTTALDINDNPFKVHGVLQIQSPVGGETWGVGTSQAISWAKTGTIPTVKLEYSTNAFDDESQVFPIADNVPSTLPVSTFDNWGIPDKIGNRLKVRVSVTGDPSVYSVSPSTFTIRGTITVTSPNGALSWIAKSTHDITWNTQGNVSRVDLAYTTDGTNYPYIVQDIPNSSPYHWTLPDVISKTCRVRVSDHNDPLTKDISDMDFYIRGDLLLTLPVGGEKWAVGSTQDMTWVTTGPIGNVGLEYSINGGISYLTILTSVSNTSHYTWSVPVNLTTHAKVRVYDVTDPGVNSVTPGEFKIQGSFGITTPNGGEPWDANTSYDIIWTSNPTAALMPFVDIDYTKDNGSHWYQIARGAPNNGRFSWYTPVEAVSTTVKVKVASAADNEAFDESDSVFNIRCHFILTYPNNPNEQLRVGRTYNITWNQVGTPDHGVTLQVSPDNFGIPGNIKTIATNVPAPLDSNSYPWTVPNYIWNTAWIRISDSDDSNAKDVSDNSFKITGDVHVDSPNGGENWEYNTIQTLQWTTAGTINNVKIEYSTDGGLNYGLIKAVPNATPPTSTTTWTIPDEVSDGCKIRISDAADSTADDVSDANFNIVPRYTLTSPNTGAEDWTVGDHHDITWTCTATVANVRLDYSTNSGANYNNVITVSTANAAKGGSRSFDWTVPNSISKTAKVRVGSAVAPAAFDASDNDFRIRGALRITAPNGGQSLQINQPYSVTWVTTGTIPLVKLLYSLNSGGTYPEPGNVIVNNLANNTTPNSYLWTVPNNRTPTARVRIVDTVNSDVLDDSDTDFRIQGFLGLNSPNGGEDWLSGDHHNISWNWGGTMPNVKLILDTNSGKGADNIAGTADDYAYVIDALAPNGAGPNGIKTYDWTVPSTLSHNCRVKVADTADDEVFDVSNADFRINGEIVITSPVGGERWVTNETHSITWTNKGDMPLVKIIYSKDDFSTFSTVVASVANAKSYPWTIPDDRSNSVKVRVLDVADETISGTSPADFRIDYYNISWDIRDLLTNERLTNLSVSEKVTGGTFVGWQAVGLTAPLVHASPYGYWTTVWSATGFGDKGQNFTADHDQSFTVYLETSAVHIWQSSAQFTYDAVGDNLKVTAWLQRDGSVVQGAAKIGIYIYDDTGTPIAYNTVCDPQYYNYASIPGGDKDQCNPKPTLFSTTIDPSGYFYMTFPAPTGLVAGKVYAALVDIMNLSGAHFKTPTSFSITESKQLQTTEAAVQEMKNVTLPGFQTGVQNTINTGIETQKQMITDIMVGTGGDPTTIMANGGMVGIIQSSMTSFETATNTAITKLQTGADTAVAAGQQLQATAKRFSWNGNVAPDPALTGDTITLQVQGQPSLMPLASIYTWDNKPVVESVILTETRPGFYVYSFLADARFTPGKAYTYMVSEQVTGGLVSGSGMVESMGITTVAGLAAAAPEAERAAKKALEAIKAVESVLVSNENINISMTLKNLKESVDALPSTLNKEGGNTQVMNAINDISARLSKMMGAEGMDFGSLLDEKLGDTSSMKQLRNKTDTISTIVDLLLQIMESKLGGVDSPIVSTSLQSGSVKFRIMAINPSKTKVQKVQVKKYLPEEVKPKDVMDLGGLELEYDSEKGIYYVYKNDLDMQPNQVNVFEVEVEDIWMIPDSQITEIKKRTDEILALFEKTPMYNTAKEVTDTIYPVLAEIPKAQIDDTVSREQHIGIYRQNQQNIKAINEKLAELEKMLAPEKGKPTPNILERNKLKVNLPTKSTTWLIILVVIVFLGVFAGIFFFVWQGQIKSSQDTIKEAAKSSFPGQKPEEKSNPPPK